MLTVRLVCETCSKNIDVWMNGEGTYNVRPCACEVKPALGMTTMALTQVESSHLCCPPVRALCVEHRAERKLTSDLLKSLANAATRLLCEHPDAGCVCYACVVGRDIRATLDQRIGLKYS